MPVQMIELEEVMMVEASDEALEGAAGRPLEYYTGNTCYPPCTYHGKD